MSLTIRECMVIDLAELCVASHSSGRRDQIIRDDLGFTATRYHQVLNSLLDRPEALAYAPMAVRRLQRLQERRQHARVRRSGRGRAPPRSVRGTLPAACLAAAVSLREPWGSSAACCSSARASSSEMSERSRTAFVGGFTASAAAGT